MQKPIKEQLQIIIFESDTQTGRLFDIVLIACIIMSIIAIMLDSVHEIHAEYGDLLFKIEWGFTILFSIEYILRLYAIGKPLKYATSFYGIIDLISILPSYLALILTGTQYAVVIRILRVLRIFRILRLIRYVGEADVLMTALIASARKITIFLMFISTLVIIFGSIMYVIEGDHQQFSSIPKGMYWAIVTISTVGYGDIIPQTVLGQTIASIVMVMGYAVIAVPTGIVTVELSQTLDGKHTGSQTCTACSREGHDADAHHCKFCGTKLDQHTR